MQTFDLCYGNEHLKEENDDKRKADKRERKKIVKKKNCLRNHSIAALVIVFAAASALAANTYSKEDYHFFLFANEEKRDMDGNQQIETKLVIVLELSARAKKAVKQIYLNSNPTDVK